MSFLLDTDICSAYLRSSPRVVSRVMMHFGGLRVSAVTVGELMVWVSRRGAPARRLDSVLDLLSACQVLDIDRSVAETFGRVRAALLDSGRPGSEMDLLNASVALVRNLTMVTHNVADYAPVPGLVIADWMIP